mgnify:CR=1 FL=1|tara:strand:- start:253 stop:390 length:138 start_codon:yes stop_codon:yes gene_type:complete
MVRKENDKNPYTDLETKKKLTNNRKKRAGTLKNRRNPNPQGIRRR